MTPSPPPGSVSSAQRGLPDEASGPHGASGEDATCPAGEAGSSRHVRDGSPNDSHDRPSAPHSKKRRSRKRVAFDVEMGHVPHFDESPMQSPKSILAEKDAMPRANSKRPSNLVSEVPSALETAVDWLLDGISTVAGTVDRSVGGALSTLVFDAGSGAPGAPTDLGASDAVGVTDRGDLFVSLETPVTSRKSGGQIPSGSLDDTGGVTWFRKGITDFDEDIDEAEAFPPLDSSIREIEDALEEELLEETRLEETRDEGARSGDLEAPSIVRLASNVVSRLRSLEEGKIVRTSLERYGRWLSAYRGRGELATADGSRQTAALVGSAAHGTQTAVGGGVTAGHETCVRPEGSDEGGSDGSPVSEEKQRATAAPGADKDDVEAGRRAPPQEGVREEVAATPPAVVPAGADDASDASSGGEGRDLNVPLSTPPSVRRAVDEAPPARDTKDLGVVSEAPPEEDVGSAAPLPFPTGEQPRESSLKNAPYRVILRGELMTAKERRHADWMQYGMSLVGLVVLIAVTTQRHEIIKASDDNQHSTAYMDYFLASGILGSIFLGLVFCLVFGALRRYHYVGGRAALWGRRRSRTFGYVMALAGVHSINLIMWISLDFVQMSSRCNWLEHRLLVLSVLQWICWDTFFFIAVCFAHDLCEVRKLHDIEKEANHPTGWFVIRRRDGARDPEASSDVASAVAEAEAEAEAGRRVRRPQAAGPLDGASKIASRVLGVPSVVIESSKTARQRAHNVVHGSMLGRLARWGKRKDQEDDGKKVDPWWPYDEHGVPRVRGIYAINLPDSARAAAGPSAWSSRMLSAMATPLLETPRSVPSPRDASGAAAAPSKGSIFSMFGWHRGSSSSRAKVRQPLRQPRLAPPVLFLDKPLRHHLVKVPVWIAGAVLVIVNSVRIARIEVHYVEGSRCSITNEALCTIDSVAYRVNVAFAGMVLIFFVLFVACRIRAIRDSKKRSHIDARPADLLGSLYGRRMMLTFVPIMICILIANLMDRQKCESMLVGRILQLPLQGLGTGIVLTTVYSFSPRIPGEMSSAALAAAVWGGAMARLGTLVLQKRQPRVRGYSPRAILRALRTWLVGRRNPLRNEEQRVPEAWMQVPIWTEGAFPRAVAARAAVAVAAGVQARHAVRLLSEPVFCVETAITALYWSQLVYDAGSLPAPMRWHPRLARRLGGVLVDEETEGDDDLAELIAHEGPFWTREETPRENARRSSGSKWQTKLRVKRRDDHAEIEPAQPIDVEERVIVGAWPTMANRKRGFIVARGAGNGILRGSSDEVSVIDPLNYTMVETQELENTEDGRGTSAVSAHAQPTETLPLVVLVGSRDIGSGVAQSRNVSRIHGGKSGSEDADDASTGERGNGAHAKGGPTTSEEGRGGTGVQSGCATLVGRSGADALVDPASVGRSSSDIRTVSVFTLMEREDVDRRTTAAEVEVEAEPLASPPVEAGSATGPTASPAAPSARKRSVSSASPCSEGARGGSPSAASRSPRLSAESRETLPAVPMSGASGVSSAKRGGPPASSSTAHSQRACSSFPSVRYRVVTPGPEASHPSLGGEPVHIGPNDQVEIVWDVKTDTKAILASGPRGVVVAFAGTSSMANVRTDLRLAQTVLLPRRRGPIGKAFLGAPVKQVVRVHAGFYDAYRGDGFREVLLSRVLRKLDGAEASEAIELSERSKRSQGSDRAPSDARQHRVTRSGEVPRRVLITGHSLGGALATLAARDVAELRPDADVRLYTFGSPRVGNRAFAAEVARLVPHTYAVINVRDPVPRVPKGLSYKRSGDRVIFLSNGDMAVNAERRDSSGFTSVSHHLLINYRASFANLLKAQFGPRAVRGGSRGAANLSRNFDLDAVFLGSGLDLASLRDPAFSPALLRTMEELDSLQRGESEEKIETVADEAVKVVKTVNQVAVSEVETAVAETVAEADVVATVGCAPFGRCVECVYSSGEAEEAAQTRTHIARVYPRVDLLYKEIEALRAAIDKSSNGSASH